MKRVFQLVLALSLAAMMAAGSLSAADYKLNVGLQTWTLRNMDFDGVVKFAKDHGITHLQMISKHIDPHGDWDEIKRRKAVLDKEGLTCYTIGVSGTSLDKEKNRRLFEFAKFMGIKLIIIEPRDFKIFDNLEELVKEYDIKVAIHNHGLTSLYGNPLVVKNVIQHRDPRIGVCLDTGWITAAGFDAGKVFRDYKGRVFDIHLKDKKVEKTKVGRDVYLDVMVGTGHSNYKSLFKELKKAKWDGVLAIETDNKGYAAMPHECVSTAQKYVKANHP